MSYITRQIKLRGEPHSIPEPQKPKNERLSGYIYLLHGNGLYKIGSTTYPKGRLREQTRNTDIRVLAVTSCRNMRYVEDWWHWRFRHRWVYSEWFDLSREEVHEFLSWAESK